MYDILYLALFWIVVARVHTGRCGRHPVSIDLYAMEGKKEPTF